MGILQHSPLLIWSLLPSPRTQGVSPGSGTSQTPQICRTTGCPHLLELSKGDFLHTHPPSHRRSQNTQTYKRPPPAPGLQGTPPSTHWAYKAPRPTRGPPGPRQAPPGGPGLPQPRPTARPFPGGPRRSRAPPGAALAPLYGTAVQSIPARRVGSGRLSPPPRSFSPRRLRSPRSPVRGPPPACPAGGPACPAAPPQDRSVLSMVQAGVARRRALSRSVARRAGCGGCCWAAAWAAAGRPPPAPPAPPSRPTAAAPAPSGECGLPGPGARSESGAGVVVGGSPCPQGAAGGGGGGSEG